MEPRTLADSETGFIDPLYTPDTPQRCGILLETVVDVIVSSPSLCCDDPAILLSSVMTTPLTLILHPENIIVSNKQKVLYILVNHTRLYSINSIDNYDFESIRYHLKQRVPCIELLEHKERFLWSCTSLSRMIYKQLSNGLLYTPNEFNWKKKKKKEEEENLMGPSMLAVPLPNRVHLPRVSGSTSAMRHYAGRSNNTRAMGEIHQKTALFTYNNNNNNYSGGVLPIPGERPLVCIANWENPEDAITIKASSLQRGLFAAESIETITVTFSTIPNNKRKRKKKDEEEEEDTIIHYEATYSDFHGPLRRETLLARVTGPLNMEINIHNYTYHGNVDCRQQQQHHHCYKTINIVWTGEEEEEGEEVEEKKKKKKPPSLAARQNNPAAYRCTLLDWTKIHYNNNNNDNTSSYRFRLVVAANFIPSLGDKLQTPTSQKGVLGHIIYDDADVPYLNIKNGESLLPDIFINPHFIKRAAFISDYINNDKYMDECFNNNDDDDVRIYLKQNANKLSGCLMDPYTGKILTRDASAFYANYILVTNHRASATEHSSRAGDTIRSDFTGAPIRGKRGGHSIGPMEHAALSDTQRINTELTHMRSDYQPLNNNYLQEDDDDEETSGGCTLASSASFKRILDDWTQAEINTRLHCIPIRRIKKEK